MVAAREMPGGPATAFLGGLGMMAGATSIGAVTTLVTIGLVNAGYQVVLPRDAVAGVPMDYAQTLIDGSYAFISTVVTTDDVVGAWL